MPLLNSTVFSLDATSAYRRWRDTKLAQFPLASGTWMVAVRTLAHPTSAELHQLHRVLARNNFVGYHTEKPVAQKAIKAFAASLGLRNLDANLCADEEGLSAITVRATGRDNDYIPYTNRSLSWHTDGYYNPLEQQVRAWLLHCIRPAAHGGENGLCDHEVAYVWLREQNPDYITALCHPEAFTLPANREGDVLVRPEQTGPVFSVDPAGHLHMRYSARKRHVLWRDDPATLAAAAALERWFAQPSPYRIQHQLTAGEGILSNNVLHNRAGFTDNPAAPRLLYRARYHDRINASGDFHAVP